MKLRGVGVRGLTSAELATAARRLGALNAALVERSTARSYLLPDPRAWLTRNACAVRKPDLPTRSSPISVTTDQRREAHPVSSSDTVHSRARTAAS
jgi:hypothetical protein